MPCMFYFLERLQGETWLVGFSENLAVLDRIGFALSMSAGCAKV